MFKYGKQELLTRMDIPFYTRKGYEKFISRTFYVSLSALWFSLWRTSICRHYGEKDSGEPFAALHNKQGYDYYSYYLLIREFGRLKTLALGNYRLSFGQGLVVSTDFLVGKEQAFLHLLSGTEVYGNMLPRMSITTFEG